MSKILAEFLGSEKPALLRSAHIFYKQKSQDVIVVRSWQAIRREANGARVLFASARFQRAQDKPTPASFLNGFANGRMRMWAASLARRRACSSLT